MDVGSCWLMQRLAIIVVLISKPNAGFPSNQVYMHKTNLQFYQDHRHTYFLLILCFCAVFLNLLPNNINRFAMRLATLPFMQFLLFFHLPSLNLLLSSISPFFLLVLIITFPIQTFNASMKLFLSLLTLLAICADCKLIYLCSFVRHGAIYPKTELYDGNETKKFQGKLTPIGMRQQYNLGTYLRAIYIDQERLIMPEFNPNQVEFFASVVDRTSVSSLSFIYGFFPLRKTLKLPSELPSDLLVPPYVRLYPDNLQSSDTQSKYLPPLAPHSTLHVLDACDNYDNLKKISEAEVRNKSLAVEQQQQHIIERLMKTFKLTPSQADSNGLSDLYKVVYADQNLGRPLPSNFTNQDRKSLNYIYKYYNALIHQGSFLRYIITPTLQFLQQKLRAASNRSTSMKMGLISLHESSSWPYLLILNLTSPDCIQQQFLGQPVTTLNCVEDLFFSSSILFELHEDIAFRQYMKVRYDGEYVKLCEREEMECPIDEFLQRLKDKEIEYAQGCKLPPNAPRSVHHRSMIIH